MEGAGGALAATLGAHKAPEALPGGGPPDRGPRMLEATSSSSPTRFRGLGPAGHPSTLLPPRLWGREAISNP